MDTENTSSAKIRSEFHWCLSQGTIVSGTEKKCSQDMGRFERMLEVAQKIEATCAARLSPAYWQAVAH